MEEMGRGGITVFTTPYNPPTLAKTRNYCSWLYSSFLYRAQALKIVMNGLNVVRVSVELHVG